MTITSKYKIVIGDIFETLEEYTNKFDLIIADPPFGIDFNKGSHEYGSKEYILYDDKFSSKEYEKFSFDWISKCYKALKDEGSMYIVSGWTHIREILNAINKTDFTIKNHIIWYFKWGVYTKKKYVSSHYHIPFLVKDSENYTFNPYHKNRHSTRKKNPYERDVWYWEDYNRGNDPHRVKGHPCQLPIRLMNRMLKISSNPKDCIGDVFSGSGGTLRSCREFGRNCISFEINPEYLDIIYKKAKINTKISFDPKKVSSQSNLDPFI